jgi:pimeloyl-ACP methyl ester carboxylesterase
MQGSSCETVLPWYMCLCDQIEGLGIGVIALEKQGISEREIDLLTYRQTNCLQQRQIDYELCLENISAICPDWEGKPIFLGESEGGTLAAIFAGKTSRVAALLLFGAGGGMKPREEVKWALRYRLEKQQATQDEIDEYTSCLDEQIDLMLLDPSPEKLFLGNTYKWWASLLAADEMTLSLAGQSLPIFLAHGVEDSQVPILSSDLAVEGLREKNALTYLRLEGYGHDLNGANVQ